MVISLFSASSFGLYYSFFKQCVEQALLNRIGYTPEINHGVLMEMAVHRKELEKKTKPILDTLRSYQDLPPVCHIFL